jgi:endonuclease/exonuclease/phosphatase family metal-dependent hydrolase
MFFTVLVLVARTLPALLIIVTVSTFRPANGQKKNAQPAPLLEFGAAQRIFQTTPGDELKLVSYNIRWRSGEDLQQIVRWLKTADGTPAAIIALQEVDRAKPRSSNVNHAKAIAEALGMYYAWAAPQTVGADKRKVVEEETGVEILSPFPLTDVVRIVLPNDGPGGRQRVALGATTAVGGRSIRVYSVHSETRLPIVKKVEQLHAVLTNLNQFPKEMPAVVLGDFNTWELPAVEGTRKLFTEAGLTTPLPDDESTFYRKAMMFDVKLKLDWIWLRGLTPQSYGIDRKLTVSDHFPLWTFVKMLTPMRAN